LWDWVTQAFPARQGAQAGAEEAAACLETRACSASSLQAEDEGKPPLRTASLDGMVTEKDFIGLLRHVLKSPTN